jgi:hypothetical protein
MVTSCALLPAVALASVVRHVYGTSIMAQAETLDQVKFLSTHAPTHLPYL